MRTVVMLFLLAFAALARVGAEPLFYTSIDVEVNPEIRGGLVYAPVSAVCATFGVSVAWDRSAGTVSITPAGRRSSSPSALPPP